MKFSCNFFGYHFKPKSAHRLPFVTSKQHKAHKFNIFNFQFQYLGVDVWLKLHVRMVAVISKFAKVLEACKKKFNLFFKRYKIENLANGI